MKQRILNICYMFLVFAALFYFLSVNVVFLHERTHLEINRWHGLNSTIEYKNFYTSGVTIIEFGNATSETFNDVKHYHLLNEIIGYNCFILMYAIMFAALLVSISILEKVKQ